MGVQEIAKELGFLRADYLIDHNGISYYEFVNEEWDEVYREHEAEMLAWEESGFSGPVPSYPEIGYPNFFSVTRDGFAMQLGVEGTAEVMSWLPDDWERVPGGGAA